MKDSYGPDAKDNIEDNLNAFESLLRKIPGFKGYLEKRDRREADQLLRETLAARFEEIRVEFSQIHEALARDIIKAIDFAEPMGRIDNRLMGLIGKIKDAPQGYAGFLDAVKVDEQKLDEIYRFDQTMVGHGEEIATAVNHLAQAVDNDSDVHGAIGTVDRAVKDANQAFASRNEIITSMS